jgi:hypothetical protein
MTKHSEAVKLWRQRHPDENRKRRREESKRYRIKYPEKDKVRQKKYKDKHPEQGRKDDKKYRVVHKEEQQIYFANYNKNNREKKRVQALISQRLSRARKRGVPDLSVALKSYCELCPEDDITSINLQRHHPDYDYPLIFMTACKVCHAYADKDRREELK